MTNKPEPLIEVVVPHRCLVGEGPVWDTQRKAICWLDIIDGEIHEYIPGQGTFRTIRVNQMIGSFAVRKNGGFIGGLKNGIGFIDQRNRRNVDLFAAPEAGLPDNRFNEGKCDPEGRFWAGTMSHGFDEGKGNLYRVDKDKTVTKQIPGVTISNGLAWTRQMAKRFITLIRLHGRWPPFGTTRLRGLSAIKGSLFKSRKRTGGRME